MASHRRDVQVVVGAVFHPKWQVNGNLAGRSTTTGNIARRPIACQRLDLVMSSQFRHDQTGRPGGARPNQQKRTEYSNFTILNHIPIVRLAGPPGKRDAPGDRGSIARAWGGPREELPSISRNVQ